MNNVYVLDHPLIKHKISLLRDKGTTKKEFRELVEEISLLLAYEVTRDLPLHDVEVETPIQKANCQQINGGNIAIIPILRAGLGMVEGMLKLIPTAKVGHVGMARNEETLQPEAYYSKLPKNIEEKEVFIIDPMLATGGSAEATITFLKEAGAKKIKLVSILAAPVGVDTVRNAHPDVDIYIAVMDEKLNGKGYIVPGLGDAGDRLFGTN